MKVVINHNQPSALLPSWLNTSSREFYPLSSFPLSKAIQLYSENTFFLISTTGGSATLAGPRFSGFS
jgi:hypothetical protein